MLFGGKVRHHLPFWWKICSDRYVLALIRGVHVPFVGHPLKQRHLPAELAMTDREKIFVDSELDHLLKNGFIRKLE